jgi:hypothetical protein
MMERPGAHTTKLPSAVWAVGPQTTGLLWEGVSIRVTVLTTDCNNITQMYIFCVTKYTTKESKQQG